MKLGNSRRSRVVTAKKYTKKRDAGASFCFASLNLLDFWRSRCRIDILNSLMREPAATQAKMHRMYFEKEVKNYSN